MKETIHRLAVLSTAHCWRLYLTLALPAVVWFSVFVPPGRVPDEPAHLLRTAQLAHGEIFGVRRDDRVGGDLDQNVLEFSHLIGRGIHGGWDEQDAAAGRALRWQGDYVFADFANVVRFAPLGYVPQIVGLRLGSLLNLTIWQSFLFARLTNALCAVALGAWAIALCSQGALFLTVILLLPMAVFVTASMSQDASIIAVSALLAALCTNPVLGAPLPQRLRFPLAAACVLFLAVARYPLAALGIVLFLPMWRRTCGVSLRKQAAAAFACGAIFTAWFGANLSLQAVMRPGVPAGISAQLTYVAAHPRVMLNLIYHAIGQQYQAWFDMFVGRLGWLDIYIPRAAARAAHLALALACVHVMFSREDRTVRRVDSIIIAFACMATLICMLIASYLTWNPVGQTFIEGMQGRYFYSIAVFVPLLVPNFSILLRVAWRESLLLACVVACVFCATDALHNAAKSVRAQYTMTERGTPSDRWPL